MVGLGLFHSVSLYQGIWTLGHVGHKWTLELWAFLEGLKTKALNLKGLYKTLYRRGGAGSPTRPTPFPGRALPGP